jgi:hypothetical protein
MSKVPSIAPLSRESSTTTPSTVTVIALPPGVKCNPAGAR